MISIAVDNVSLSYGTDIILDNISFSLNDGDKLGIVGVNGAGKSSLLSIIMGNITENEGSVYISKGKTVGFLAQNAEYSSDKSVYEAVLEVFSELTAMENELSRLETLSLNGDETAGVRFLELNEKFLSLGGAQYKGRAKGILISLGFDENMINMPVTSLSGGQKTRVSLAALLLKEPDIIILDEPTNHLDIGSIVWLEKYLVSCKKTIITVSHDRYFLCTVTNKTFEIENHKGKMYNGNYDKYIEQKKADRKILEHQYKSQQKEIARIEAYIEQQRRWNRERNIIAAESRQKQLDKMERIDAPAPDPENIRISFTKSEESGYDVLSVRRLSKSFGSKKIFENLSFELKKRDNMIIIGSNGCGKSTLLKILCGKLNADSGVFDYGYNVTVGYYDQENQNLTPENTVLDELWNSYPTKGMTEVRNALALFLFKGDDIEKKICNLSGGEKARITFAKLMLSKFNLLFLDEPTNHLDIMSREVLEDALEKFDGTIVAVSHDRYFIKKLATRILSFTDSGVIDYIGSYEEYLSYAERLTPERESSSSVSQSSSKNEREKAKKDLSDKRRIERKIKSSKEELEKAEKRIAEITEEEAAYSTDHIKLTELYNEREELESKMLTLMEFLENSGEEY